MNAVFNTPLADVSFGGGFLGLLLLIILIVLLIRIL